MKSLRNVLLTALSLFSLLVFTQCSKKDNELSPKIASLIGNWQLAEPNSSYEVNLNFTLDEKNPPNDVTPLFGGGRSSVNEYNARFFATVDGMMVVDPIGSTKVAGEPAAMQFEQTYYTNLRAVVRYELTSDQLKLSYGGDKPGTLVYKRVK
ncbi:META domain-containing protein [Spirosoma sp. BT702]|uniref:META domain-containing protein n=1 Tax=Spirosoma profusum TaxID=2771354 RepID=A0A927ARL8_9BACT|nr:META domain-containing protein [Spirosoma profusum]MBD2702538.1 META domain-containing protein [Spirosoma profusum]